MRWFAALFLDELRIQLRRSGPYVFAAIYAAMGILVMIAIGGVFESVRVGVGSGNVKIDGPYTITILSLTTSLFLTMNVAAIAGHAACRDVEDGSFPFVYSAPLSKWGLFGARFLASLVVLSGIALAIPVGYLVGARLPVLEAERVGSWSLGSGAIAWIGWLLPNLVATGAFFFGLAAITRRMFPNYIGGVTLLVGYLGAQSLMADVTYDKSAALLDPFGLAAFDYLTRYWSPFESNTRQVWPLGIALANRVGWTALGLLVFAGGTALARLDQHGRSLPWRRSPPRTEEADDPHAARRPVPVASRRFDRGARLFQGWALTRRAVGDVLGHRYFWAFVAASVLFQLLNAQVIGTMYGTETWPVTWQVIEVLRGTLGLFLLLVVTFYAGDLVWHERDQRTAELYDATPMPDLLPLLAKVAALIAIVAGMHATVLVVGLLVQLWAGYTHFELGLYVQWLFGWSMLEWIPFVALTIAVHAVANAKWVGHFVLIAFFLLRNFRTALGFEYNLPWFGSDPGLVWSDMNGWGWYLWPFLVYQGLWFAVGAVLLVLARLGWVRGTESGRAVRVREARRRLDGGTRAALGWSVAATLAFAAWIAVETSWTGTYRSTTARTRLQVAYEREVGPEWATRPQPRVTAAQLWVDLFPRTGTVRASGLLTLRNQSEAPVARILVGLRPETVLSSLTFDRTVAEQTRDEEKGQRVVTFATPLAPGEQTVLRFEVHRARVGWPNSGAETAVTANGSFVHSDLFVPSIGYQRDAEVSSKSERRKYGLPPRSRMLDPEDPLARTRNYVGPDGDWVDLDITVTTDADQVALAPGELLASGVRDGRAWFHYRPEHPVLHFTAVLSGRWAIRRAEWRDVKLEVYYHPDHAYNIERMVESMQHSLELFSTAFSPFQYHTLRIVEFPRYERFAQSFPSTIPYSEAIGFIARIGDPDEDVDYVYYVTAHEVAHQWWAHQLIGGDAQGSTVLSETLAQYSALKVMVAEYGEEQIHRFLAYEMDQYFTGRAFETDREVPLMRVEDQGYIHYNKGSVVMWALRQEVGETRLDEAIRTFLQAWAGRGPPYPTGEDFVAHLKQALPEAKQTIEESFESIVLFENRTDTATAKRGPDGRWTVDLTFTLDRTKADEVGAEQPVPFDRTVEVGIFAGTEADREVLHLARHRLVGPTAQLSIVVDREPTRAGIDPNHLLLDRNHDDNVIDVVR